MLWKIISFIAGIEEPKLDMTSKIREAERYIVGCTTLPEKERIKEINNVVKTIFGEYFFSNDDLSRKSKKELNKFLNKYSNHIFSLNGYSAKINI